MKTITTQLQDDFIKGVCATLNHLEFLKILADDDFFILEDTDTQNYIQTTPDDDGNGFLTEMRLYSDFHKDENDFTHFSTFIKNSDELLILFDKFFHDMPIDTSNWKDISKAFADHVYIKTDIDDTPFDYYLFRDDYLCNSLLEAIIRMTSKKDKFSIYPNGEDSVPILNIGFDGRDYTITYQDNEQNITKPVKNLEHLTSILKHFFNNNMSDFAH